MTLAYTKTQHDFLFELGAIPESEHRQLALLSVAETFQNCYASRSRTRQAAIEYGKLRFHERLRERYGSILALFIILTIAGAALSWAVERFLDWLFPEDSVHPHELRSAAIIQMQQRWRAGE